MGTIKTCQNGHNYDSGVYTSCPYCPKGTGENRTVANPGMSPSIPKTEMASPGNSSRTTIVAPGASFNANAATSAPMGMTPDNRTSMPGNSTKIFDPDAGEVTHNRKLVGFLVSFDLNPQGKHFRVYEGKNLVGTDVSSDVVISGDPGVSGKHLTILYRNGVCRFRDEFSTNGSYLNEQPTEEAFLNNYDIIRIGRTRLIYMAIPFENIK